MMNQENNRIEGSKDTNTPELNEQELNNVAGGLSPDMYDEDIIPHRVPYFRVGSAVTTWNGIHWYVTKVMGSEEFITYEVQAVEIPDDWKDWIKAGDTMNYPESQLTGGWN